MITNKATDEQNDNLLTRNYHQCGKLDKFIVLNLRVIKFRLGSIRELSVPTKYGILGMSTPNVLQLASLIH